MEALLQLTVPDPFTRGAEKDSALCFELNVPQSVEVRHPVTEFDALLQLTVPAPLTSGAEKLSAVGVPETWE